MLNQYLSESDLHSDLSDFLDSYNFMLAQFDPERKISVYQDKKLLAKLHHSLNIDKYKSKAFRQKLFTSAPNDQIIEFAKSRNIHHTSAEATTQKFRDRLASFAWGCNDETRNFVRIFGYPEYMIPSTDEEIKSKETITPHATPFKQLKEYQAGVVFDALEQIEIPNSRFLIHMPTGGGKTRVAMEVIANFLNKKEDRRVVWLADRVELCEQAMEAFLDVWQHLGLRKLDVYRIWGDAEIPPQITGSGFIVVMYQKIRNKILRGDVSIKADAVVPDEAHSAVAPTYSRIIEGLKDIHHRQTRIMGLTATPGRGSGDIDDNQDLANMFGDKIVRIPTTEYGVIEFLQRKRILAKCIRRPLNTNIRYTFTKQEWKQMSRSFEREFPSEFLEKIANDEKRNTKILITLRKLVKECRHILVFCGSRKQSKLLSGFMAVSGYSSAHIDSSSPAEYRSDVVRKFRSGEMQLVFNYGVFTAGFDAPKIDAVVIARPTTSVVLYGQMIGRGMRGPDIGGTERFQLIDVVDDIITEYSGLDNVYEYFSEYWDT